MKIPQLIVYGCFALAVVAAWFDRIPDVSRRLAHSQGTSFASAVDQPLPDAIQLIYWEKWNGFEGEAMQQVVDIFNRRSRMAFEGAESFTDEERSHYLSPTGKSIFVRMLSVPQIDRKTLLATSGGAPPDIAGLWNQKLADFARHNALLSLDEYIARDGPIATDYYESVWRLCQIDDSIWALPTTPATVGLYWNKERFIEAGLDPERPPRNLEELESYSEKLTEYDAQGRIVRLGFMPSEPAWLRASWGVWFGGRHSSEDGRELLCQAPEWLAAWNWANRQADKLGREALSVFEGGMGSFDSPQNPFISGKIAMTLQGVWLANFIRLYRPSMTWGATMLPFPGGTEQEPVTAVMTDVLALPRGSPKPEEAWRFLRFANTQEALELLCRAQGKFTPLRRVSREFMQDHPHAGLKVFMQMAESPRAFPYSEAMPIWQEYFKETSSAFEQVWRRGHTPEFAPDRMLQQLKQRMQLKLDRAWQKSDRLLQRNERNGR